MQSASFQKCKNIYQTSHIAPCQISCISRGPFHLPEPRWRGMGLPEAPVQQQQFKHRSAMKGGPAAVSSQQSVDPSLIALAHRLADAAAAVTTPYFRSPLIIEAKPDASPVTEADKKAEAVMQKLIKAEYPEHSIFGEEEGMHVGSTAGTAGKSSYLWVLDPIDGTKSFITGKPLYGTLIALLRDGEPILGVIDQPILKERWLGVAGQQTTLNGKPVKARQCKDISAAYLYATSPSMFTGASETSFNCVRDAVRTAMYGCDCYAYGLLAIGTCDLVVEADMKPYDYMALVPIVLGAGGMMTDWQGRPLHWQQTPQQEYSLDSLPGEVIAAGDLHVHQQALELLGWEDKL